MHVPWLLSSLVWQGALVRSPSRMLVEMGPTYFDVRFFVRLIVVILLLQLSLPRIFADL